ncbi:tyrosine-type recombinase/integrase [Desulfonatronum parangueonense]
MPKVHLRPAFVADPPLPKDKAKIDYFDTQLQGFLLEVRSTGTSTFYLRYRDNSGNLKQIKIGTPQTIGVEDARNIAKTMKSQSVIGFDPHQAQTKLKAIPTFRDFVKNNYIPYIKTYKRSWEYDQTAIEQRMMKLWGQKKLTDISKHDLVDLQNKLSAGGLKPGSVNRNMAIVKYIFSLAERWEIIDKSPARHIPKLAENNQKERFLTVEEMQRLLTALKECSSDVVPDIVELLMVTGARKSEVVELEWKELNLEKATWTLPASRNKAKRPKTIPLSDRAVEVLTRRQSNGSKYVFPNPKTGQPLQYFFSTWNRIRKAAGIPDVRLHDLRHSYASFLVNSGRSLYEVQKLLGHSQISTTQRYAHLTYGTLSEATKIMDTLVGI